MIILILNYYLFIGFYLLLQVLADVYVAVNFWSQLIL